MPFIRKVWGKTEPFTLSQDFYEFQDDVARKVSVFDGHIADGNKELAAKYLDKHQGVFDFADLRAPGQDVPLYIKIRNEITAFNKEIKEAGDDQEIIKLIKRDRDEAMRDHNLLYRRAREQKSN